MGIAIQTGPLCWNLENKWRFGLRRYPRDQWCLFFGFGSVAHWRHVSGWGVKCLH
jgi:hypothetical protein